jgi:hypothetical protein
VNVSGLANEVPAGSAGAPAIYPTGDSNTGIFFPAADTIAFAEGGAEVARFDNAGRLLIGTTSPSALLHVNGAVLFPQRRRGFIYAAGVSAGTTGTYNIDISGFVGEGSGSAENQSRFFFVTMASLTFNHQVQAVGLYTTNFNGHALALSKVAQYEFNGTATFTNNGGSPRITVTNGSGGTPNYWAEIVFLN